MKTAPKSSEQPLLWSDPALDRGIANIRWSYSRRSVLEQCPRRYYYEYHGGSAGSQDPRREIIACLKNVQTRHELAGTVLHSVIGGYFRRTLGEIGSLDELSKKAWGGFRRIWDSSEAAVKEGSALAALNQQTVLHEYYYPTKNADEICRAAEDRLLQAVAAFATADCFAQFRAWGEDPSSLVECRIHVDKFPCIIDGRLDLAHHSNSQSAVVDWKLGDSSNRGDDSLQLAAYAMWAGGHFGVPAESISVFKAYLTGRSVERFSASNQVLERARARIIQDAERMAALQDYGQKSIADAFTPCPQKRVCAACPFLGICHEGRAVVDA